MTPSSWQWLTTSTILRNTCAACMERTQGTRRGMQGRNAPRSARRVAIVSVAAQHSAARHARHSSGGDGAPGSAAAPRTALRRCITARRSAFVARTLHSGEQSKPCRTLRSVKCCASTMWSNSSPPSQSSMAMCTKSLSSCTLCARVGRGGWCGGCARDGRAQRAAEGAAGRRAGSSDGAVLGACARAGMRARV